MDAAMLQRNLSHGCARRSCGVWGGGSAPTRVVWTVRCRRLLHSGNEQMSDVETTALIEELTAALSEEAVSVSPEDRAYYGTDRCKGGWPIDACAVVRPADLEGVQRVVRICAARRIAIVPSGGRTGLTGAATASCGEIVLSLERMRGILEVDTHARTLRCEPGATVEDVQRAAADAGLMYPVDFAAKGTAHIGGSIATNAGGVRVLRYGSTRAWVRELKVVLASGEVIKTGGALVKDNPGYELRQLFIGSEGTLGIIVEATLALCVPPVGTVVALTALDDASHIRTLFRRMQDSGLHLSAFECFDQGCVRRVCAHRGDAQAPGPFAERAPHHVLIEVEVPSSARDGRDGVQAQVEAVFDDLAMCLADAQDAEEIRDAVVATTPRQMQELWAWREDISESLHVATPHKADVSVPVSEVVPFMEAWRDAVNAGLPSIPAVCFGHVGDGNLHLNLLCPEDMDHGTFLGCAKLFDRKMYALVESFAGSISAEHGVGLLKRAHLHHTKSPGEIALMREIKKSLDPQGIMNPGKIFEMKVPV